MSDSDATDLPSEATISRALRDVVISIYKSGNTDDLTVKRVRSRAEESLGLPAGFLKANQDWKGKSQSVIHEAVEKYCADEPAPEPKAAPPKKAPKPKAPQPKAPAPKKPKPASDSPRGMKRKAVAPAKKPQKRKKTAVSSDEELSDVPDALLDAESEAPRKPTRRQKKVVTEDSDGEDAPETAPGNAVKDEDDESDTAPAVKAPEPEPKQTPPAEAKGDVSESELSSLIDESPAKKKRQKKPPTEKRGKERKTKESKATKSKPKASKAKVDDDPDQAEIKRLQSWLVKCGIRKIWSKELAKCDSSKEKIRHLKGMLKDAGMDGKYSVERAARIKEEREFAKDLEEIQAGAQLWGKADPTEDVGRPRRRLNRGSQNVLVRDQDDNDDDEQKEEEASNDDKDDEVEAESEDNGDESDESD